MKVNILACAGLSRERAYATTGGRAGALWQRDDRGQSAHDGSACENIRQRSIMTQTADSM